MRRLSGLFCGAAAAVVLVTAIGGAAEAAPAPQARAAQAIARMGHVKLPRAITRAVPATVPNGRPAIRSPRLTTTLPKPRDVVTANITVNYAAGFPANAQAAFQAAVDIWKTKIVSPTPIVIDASWTDLTAKYGSADILGDAGPTDFVSNFPGAPKRNVFYPVALANAISGSDQEPVGSANSPDGAEISAEFNSAPAATWYFGTDGLPGSTQEDLETVVLHELGHGLGFLGTFDGINETTQSDDGVGYYGLSGDGTDPTVFDTFATDTWGTPLISAAYPNGSRALGNVLRGLANGGAHWGGAWGIRAAGFRRPTLWSPSAWSAGSSFSHLDENVYPAGTANALMTPGVTSGEAVHDPGPIMLAMFRDMGWPNPCTSTVPATSPSDTFHPTTPQRIYSATGYSGRPIDVPATGLAGVPTNGTVDAVAVNVEVYQPSNSGSVAVLPGCAAYSNTNPTAQQYDAGRTRSQLVVVRLNSEGGIRIWLSRGSALVNVDIAGWYSATGGDRYHPLPVTWLAPWGVNMKSGVPFDEQVLGLAGIPASGVDAVVLKVSVRIPSTNGWVVISPGGTNTANGTQAYVTGQRISNLVIVHPVNGKIRLRVINGTANVAFEVEGWFGTPGSTAGLLFHPGNGPVRLLNGVSAGTAVIGGLPASTPVLLNVATGQPTASGWTGTGPVGGSVLRGTQEYYAGHSITGLIFADVSSAGQVRVHPSAGTATLYVDQEGWFAAT